jgi:hypothetical protein
MSEIMNMFVEESVKLTVRLNALHSVLGILGIMNIWK